MSDNHHEDVKGPAPHVLPLSVYWGVFAALIFLTLTTVATAQVDIGVFNFPLAMVIATVKASLVALIFMHLWFDHKLNGMLFVTTLIFLSVFIVLTMFDTEGRGLVDPVKENYDPRNEKVQEWESENPGALPLRPAFAEPTDEDVKSKLRDPHAH